MVEDDDDVFGVSVEDFLGGNMPVTGRLKEEEDEEEEERRTPLTRILDEEDTSIKRPSSKLIIAVVRKGIGGRKNDQFLFRCAVAYL